MSTTIKPQRRDDDVAPAPERARGGEECDQTSTLGVPTQVRFPHEVTS